MGIIKFALRFDRILVFQLKELKAIHGQFIYEVTDLHLLKLHKETQTIKNTANRYSNTGYRMDSFLPIIFYATENAFQPGCFCCKQNGFFF